MSNALERICNDKRSHIAERKARLPMGQLLAAAERATPPRRFAAALAAACAVGYGLIAEIKRASPSKGLIRPDFDAAVLAGGYAAGGATCLSVLTDGPYFEGADEHLTAARAAVELPVLRKDFMLDPYQVIEARALGADCILLIMAALDDALARDLEDVARSYGMDVLIEVHDEAELERALRLHSPLIGVNNRDLRTLATDTATTRRLAGRIPADRLLVCESGLNGPADLAEMAAVGARCFLIGEALMRQPDVAQAVRAMLANPAPVSATANRKARP
jgi:indole-3-glycerol phosphate synthase